MRLMDDILRPLTNSFMVVYLDDILIFSKSWEEHLQRIWQVLQTLQQHKLCDNLEKCTFGMRQVQYLGYIIDERGVHVDPTKIQVIWDWPAATTNGASQLLGPCNFLSEAFVELKHQLYSASILTLPDLQQPFEIETNTLDYAIGAVLTQHGHLVAYHSATLSYTIRKYPTYDKEKYSIVQDFQQWKHYILGKEMVIHIDHCPLQFMQTQGKLQRNHHQKGYTYL
eukprot:PITA_12180